MRLLTNLFRITLGLVFVFSGFVKAVDPLGSMYKFVDYFQAFSMEFFKPIALPLGILLAAIEFLLGVNLFFNLKMKFSSKILLGFMGFFTILTFVLALTNPVSDCGCFGDAIILTNWETFYKNIILMLFAVFVFMFRNKFKPAYSNLIQNVFITISTAFILFVSIYSYNHLPIIDFRPYSIGKNIADGMKIPEGAPVDQYETILVYSKGGVNKEFTEENYPWQDSTWTFVDSKQKLIKAGYHPPIKDFIVYKEGEGEITESLLQNEDYVFLLISHNLNKANFKNNEQINKIADFCSAQGFTFYCITATVNNELEKFKEKYFPVYEFCSADETNLKTVIRSNPGLLLLKKGTVINKWHFNDLPDTKDLKGNLVSKYIEENQNDKSKYLNIIFVLSFLLIGVILFKAKRK